MNTFFFFLMPFFGGFFKRLFFVLFFQSTSLFYVVKLFVQNNIKKLRQKKVRNKIHNLVSQRHETHIKNITNEYLKGFNVTKELYSISVVEIHPKIRLTEVSERVLDLGW